MGRSGCGVFAGSSQTKCSVECITLADAQQAVALASVAATNRGSVAVAIAMVAAHAQIRHMSDKFKHMCNVAMSYSMTFQFLTCSGERPSDEHSGDSPSDEHSSDSPSDEHF